MKGNLEIGGNGTGSVNFLNENTNSNPVLVQGNLTIKSGSTLRNYGTGFEVQGNLTINGTILYDSNGERKLVFSGSNMQTISGSGTLNVYTCEINKSLNTLILNRTLSIDHLLTLSTGKISLGSNDLIFATSATINGYDSTSYIVTSGTGKIIKKYSTTGTAFTFPTGDSINYTPFTLTLNTATLGSDPYLSVRVIDSVESHVSAYADYASRYWKVNTNDITNINTDVNYTYYNGDITGNENNFLATRWNAVSGLKKAGAVNDSTNTATATGISEVGSFGVAGICNVVAEAGNDTIVGFGQCIKLGSDTISGYSYSWSPGITMSDSTIANPIALPIGTTKYFMHIVNEFSCETTDSVLITVIGTGSMGEECLLDTVLKVKDGTQGEIYNKTACGLNYVAKSVTLAMRCSDSPDVPFIPGTPQPAALNITGIPVGATIDRAYLYWMIERAQVPNGAGTTSSVLLQNPDLTMNLIPGVLIGSYNYGNCWGHHPDDGATCFRADVTYNLTQDIINGYNGNYVVSGLPTSIFNPSSNQNKLDTEGLTLLIIYVDPTTNLKGTLILYDGFIIDRIGTAPLNVQLSGFNASNVTGIQKAFVQLADFQKFSDDATISLNSNPTTIFLQELWDYEEENTTVTNGQTTSNFIVNQPTPIDCVSWIFSGLYYQSYLTLPDDAQDQTVCPGGTVQIGYTYVPPEYTGTFHWSPSTGLNYTNWSAPIATPATTTTYTVTYTDGGGCSATDAVTVYISNPTAQAGPDVSICLGESHVIGDPPPPYYLGNFNWNPSTYLSNPNSVCPNAFPTTTTTYTVTHTDLFGCTATDAVTVTVYPLPNVTINADPNPFCEGSFSTLTASGASTYLWSNGSTTESIVVLPSTPTSYTVTGTDEHGCSATDSIYVYSVVCTCPG